MKIRVFFLHEQNAEKRVETGLFTFASSPLVENREREKNPEPVFLSAGNGGLCVCARMWKGGEAANSGDIEIDDA